MKIDKGLLRISNRNKMASFLKNPLQFIHILNNTSNLYNNLYNRYKDNNYFFRLFYINLIIKSLKN